MLRKIFKPFEIVIFALLIIFLGMLITALIVRTNVTWCEGWTTSVSRGYISFMNKVSAVFPFSLFEVGLIVLIIAVITLLVLMIISFAKHKKRRGFRELGVIITFVVAVVASYSFIVTPMYNREPINSVPQYEEKVEQNQYWTIAEYFKDDFNKCASQLEFSETGEVIAPYDVYTIGNLLNETYEKINDPYLNQGYVRVKPMFLSPIYRELHITGVSFAISGEANVNYLNDASSIPFTSAHELAHQKGVMNEDDANLYALYICLKSDNPYIRYSGYYNGMYAMLSLLDYTGHDGDYAKMYYEFSKEIQYNYAFSNKYWKEHDLLGSIGEFFNNIYLKLNGGSTSDYTDDYVEPPSDSGEKGDEGEIIYNITYTPYQKLFFDIYYS